MNTGKPNQSIYSHYQYTLEKKGGSHDFSYLLGVLFHHKKLILITCLVSAIIAIFNHICYLPTYSAESMVYLEIASGDSLKDILINNNSFNGMSANHEMERYIRYLQSERFLVPLADSLKLHPDFNKLDLTNPKGVRVVNREFWKRYSRNHKKPAIEPELSFKESIKNFHQALSIDANKLAQQIAPLIRFQTNYSYYIQIIVDSFDPFTSQTLANLAAQEFQKLNTSQSNNELSEIETFLKSRINQTREHLRETENKFVRLRRSHEVATTESRGLVYSSNLKDISGKLENARLALSETEKKMEMLEAIAKNSPQTAKSEQTVRASLQNLNQKKRELLAAGAAPDSREISKLNQQITLLSVELDSLSAQSDQNSSPEVAAFKLEELRKKKQELSERVEILARSEQALIGKLKEVPEAEQEVQKLQRQTELDYELLATLNKKMDQLQIQRFSAQKKIQIEHLAAGSGMAPRVNLVLKIFFSLLIGLFIGCVVAFMREFLDPTVKHGADLENADLEVLGEIPNLNELPATGKIPLFSQKRQRTLSPPEMLVCKHAPDSIEAMAFKYVRTRIQRVKESDGSPARTVLITSAEQGDGKSLVSCNLAISLAQLGKKVILLDCDFRRPMINRYFGLPNKIGLASLLTMTATLEEALVVEQPANLHVLCSGWGVEKPTELIGDDKLPTLLNHLKSRYDYVIIDSPPINSVVDASLLAEMASCVIFVAGYRKTKKDLLLYAQRNIQHMCYKKLFGVLNRVDWLNFMLPYSSYYGYGYHAHPARQNNHGRATLRAVPPPQAELPSSEDGEQPAIRNRRKFR